MKLNQDQLDQIKGYLNKMGLTQIDLKLEVLDHISLEIERQLENRMLFEDAFEIEKKKWAPELRSEHSLWIGLQQTGPKIMIDKCARITKELYLKSGITALLAILIIYFLRQFWNNDPGILILKYGVGGLLLFGALFMIYEYSHSQREVSETSYSFIIKPNIIGYFMLVIACNPFLNSFPFELDNSAIYMILFFNAFTLAFGVYTFKLFQNHRLQIKKYFAQ